MAPTVLVIGASGYLGVPVLDQLLLNSDKFDRIGILTDPSRAGKFSDTKSRGAEIVVGSFLESQSYAGFDTVLSLVGNKLMKLQPGMIEAAAAGGVRHFYPSEFGADLGNNNPQLYHSRYFRDKYATREHLADKASEIPGFKYTLLLVGSFTEVGVSPFFGIDTDKHTVELYGTEDAFVSTTAHLDIAKYLVKSILLPFRSAVSCRTIRVAGERSTWKELIAMLEEMQGVKYTTKYLSPDLALEKEVEAWKAGDVDGALIWSVKAISATGASDYEPIDNKLFDFEPEKRRVTFARMLGKE